MKTCGRRILKPEMKDKIQKLYLEDDLMVKEIAEKYDVSASAICDFIKRENIPKRPICRIDRKYKINHFIFQEIDTEEKAYWLGFLGADGSNNEKKGCLTLLLSSKDIDHMEKFKKFLGTDAPIKVFNRKSPRSENVYEYCKITIQCRQISSDLAKFGVVQNKALIYNPHRAIPKDLWIPFIRGLFDGDGGYSKHITKRDGTLQTNACLTGTKESCLFFKEIFSPYGFKFELSQRWVNEKNNWQIKIHGNFNVWSFGEILYKDSKEHLARKFKIWREIKNDYKSKRRVDKIFGIIYRNGFYFYEFVFNKKQYRGANRLKIEDAKNECRLKMIEVGYLNGVRKLDLTSLSLD